MISRLTSHSQAEKFYDDEPVQTQEDSEIHTQAWSKTTENQWKIVMHTFPSNTELQYYRFRFSADFFGPKTFSFRNFFLSNGEISTKYYKKDDSIQICISSVVKIKFNKIVKK